MELIVSQPIEERQPGLVGCSETIRAIEHTVDSAALSDAHVLITGETGVEKEAVARLIHDRSLRAPLNFVTVNCAGLPDVLVESELFGHMRGSFPGAYRDKPGLVELSPNGSLFLDDVGELSPAIQAVVLRFLESGEVHRVGAARAHANVHVRVIAATSQDLGAQVAAGLFREDLYSLLTGIRLTIQPLRERTEDIPLLADYFLRSARPCWGARARTISAAALHALTAYRWPGNVRELQDVVEWMVFRAHGPVVQPSEVPAQVFRSERDPGRFSRASSVSRGSRPSESG
jgi:DNA-binding NtrC family response regulator